MDPNAPKLTEHSNPEVRAFARLLQTLGLLRARAEQPAEAAVYLREEQRAERSLAGVMAKQEAEGARQVAAAAA